MVTDSNQASSGCSPSHGGGMMYHHRNRRGAIMPGSLEAKWAADAAREYALQELAEAEAGAEVLRMMSVWSMQDSPAQTRNRSAD